MNYLDLEICERLLSNVYEAKNLNPVLRIKNCNASTRYNFVMKFARFPWETHYHDVETLVYEWIDGHDIDPRFMGYLIEESRVIGLVLERIKGARHAGLDDLEVCQETLTRLHQLGLLHGDVNRHNFLIRPVGGRKSQLWSISRLREDVQMTLAEELETLQQELNATHNRGANFRTDDEEETLAKSGSGPAAVNFARPLLPSIKSYSTN